jgi:16S rRNA (cytidine1402-2'-O)-methyltransferase
MAAVCREISKLHEECKRGTVEELHKWYSSHEPKGEIVMIVSGAGYDGGEQSEEE